MFTLEIMKRGFASNQIVTVSCIREGMLKDVFIGEINLEI
jgi:hypothetical protein